MILILLVYGTLVSVLCSLVFMDYFKTRNWWRSLVNILSQGKYNTLPLFIGLVPLGVLNKFFMNLEDIFLPSLNRLTHDFFEKPGKVVLVLGHPRSGTTNLQKSLMSLDFTTGGNQYDLVFPSLTLKYLCWPLRRAVNWFFFRSVVQGDTANHQMGIDEELEEHLLLHHLAVGDAWAGCLFPRLSEDKEFLRKSAKFERYQIEFVKRCIVRNIYWRGAADKIYVGGPICFAGCADLVRKVMPKAQLVISVRDPKQSFPSLVDMALNLLGDELNDVFKLRLKNYYEAMTCPLYTALARFEPDELTYMLDFENWKKDSQAEIEHVWKWLQWKVPSQASKVALKRSEKHQNKPQSYLLVPTERIDSDIGQAYKLIQSRC